MYHPLEVNVMIKKETDILYKHIETLKKRVQELEDTNKQLRSDLNRPSTTKWVDNK